MKRRKLHRSKKKSWSAKRDYLTIYFLPIILSILGLFFIFEASSITAFRNIGDSFHFVKLQLMWFVIGVVAMSVVGGVDYHKLYYLSFPMLGLSIVLLILVLIPGIGSSVYGARRWIDFGFVRIQPSEVTKLGAILYLSSWFLYKERKRFFSFFLLLMFIITLVMIQPNMGTAIILFGVFCCTYFLAGVDLKYLLFLVPFSTAGFLLLAYTSPYRVRRFMAFLNPEVDPQGISYHVNQILISLSGGGLLGRGFSQSRQKYQYLPEAHTDSIFAILGEEFGFVGGAIVICIYAFLLYKIYSIAKNAKDRFGFLLAGSIFSLIGLQVVINLGAMVNVIPLTGVPLPFISYGGSSLVIFFVLMGILISISRKS